MPHLGTSSAEAPSYRVPGARRRYTRSGGRAAGRGARPPWCAPGTRTGSARGVRIVLLTATPCALLLPLAAPGPRLALYVLGSLVTIAGVVLGNVVLGSFRQSYTPPALLSRVAATSMFANQATIPLGALTGGLLGSALGLRPAMWIMTGLLVLSAAVLLASPLRTSRDLPTGRAQGLSDNSRRARDAGHPA
ncbi:hypothetical protein [Kitasatospora sp. NPDC097643]|uniref:hypothetical protein n=1 Tax=Kitasatospora sp. NPDC097643 TaxID=3157230 RepID=UPI00331DB4C5